MSTATDLAAHAERAGHRGIAAEARGNELLAGVGDGVGGENLIGARALAAGPEQIRGFAREDCGGGVGGALQRIGRSFAGKEKLDLKGDGIARHRGHVAQAN